MTDAMYLVTMFAVGFFVIGAHGSLHSIAGVHYPSAYRANGAGWALAISRLGSIGGPLIGGFMLAAHWPLVGSFCSSGCRPSSWPSAFSASAFSIDRSCPRRRRFTLPRPNPARLRNSASVRRLLRWIAELSEHEANRSEAQECKRLGNLAPALKITRTDSYQFDYSADRRSETADIGFRPIPIPPHLPREAPPYERAFQRRCAMAS